MTVRLVAPFATTVAVIVAMLGVSQAAQAGGGVNLGFGFPLGTFKATPAHGGSGTPSAAKPTRKAPTESHRAAVKHEKAAPRVAKSEPQKPAVTKTAPETQPVTAEKADDGASAAKPPVTGSSALLQQSLPVESPSAAGAPPATADNGATCKKFIPAIGTTVSVGCGE